MPENSNIYMPLAQSPTFTSRVQYILVQEGPVIMAEASSSPASTHQARANLAFSVVKNPAAFAPVFAVHLAANVNVTSGGALTGTAAAGTLDTPATDAALLAAVASLWSTVSGVIVNP